MLNALEIVFLLLAASAWAGGEAVTRWRKSLPPLVLQSYLYGSFAHRGEQSALARSCELPKSAFRHFYVFAALLGSAALALMLAVYSGFSEPSYLVQSVLMGLLNCDEPAVCSVAALAAMVLLMLQIYRRLYETHCLQVFAENSRINISHYATGFAHYLGCIVTLLGQAPLFSAEKGGHWLDRYTSIVLLPSSIVFMVACYEQYQTNLILSNLRRDDKSGVVVTEKHGVPHGRWFDLVSSPHRLAEITMYTALLMLIPTRTFFCIYLWVVANQVQTALQAHQWYKITFKNYPKKREALFPYSLRIKLSSI